MIKYEDHQHTIEAAAQVWAAKTGLELDDFISVGNMAFVHAAADHNPNGKAGFGTFLWKYINTACHNLAQTELNRTNRLPSSSENYDGPASIWSNPERAVIFKDSLEKLSELGRGVANIVLNPPEIVCKWAVASRKSPVLTRRLIERYLMTIKGWRGIDVRRGFNEVTTALA